MKGSNQITTMKKYRTYTSQKVTNIQMWNYYPHVTTTWSIMYNI